MPDRQREQLWGGSVSPLSGCRLRGEGYGGEQWGQLVVATPHPKGWDCRMGSTIQHLLAMGQLEQAGREQVAFWKAEGETWAASR